MIARYKGDRYRDIEGINPFSTGEGPVLAEAVEANLVNMDVTIKAARVEELAQSRGLDAGTLAETVRRMSDEVAQERTDPFGRAELRVSTLQTMRRHYDHPTLRGSTT